tara:strand:+ start:18730 stop:19902 length:1173 start_codon:yes stop_codon:yes gene_type:complete
MTVRIITGDARERLQELPDASVHCCVTSPPYFGLRDYGTAEWAGGNVGCDHTETSSGMSSKNTLGPLGKLPQTNAANVGRLKQYRETCRKCGATRTDLQMGLEPTPDEFVAGMVALFSEVRRVLRDDGTLWLNLGDSYAANRGYQVEQTKGGPKHGPAQAAGGRPQRASGYGLKPKDIIGIPWRVAFALQADGWYLRQDIIWAKPNPMPESVKDRCTKAHEYIFMLSKSAKYHYDADAIAEPAIYAGLPGQDKSGYKDAQAYNGKHKKADKQRGHGRRHAGFNDRWDAMSKAEQCSGTRNKRSVWEVTTKPFSEAHFATYPPKLIEPCILAGCPVGGTVLDPFFGAGTTGMVADRLGRDCIGIELNPEYAALAERRLQNDGGMFSEVNST